MEINTPFISVIYGPMFSGKTTKLLELYNLYVKMYGKDKCIAINYILDNRYGENRLTSHNKLSIECYSVKNIEEFKYEDFVVEGYNPDAVIKMKMAV